MKKPYSAGAIHVDDASAFQVGTEVLPEYRFPFVAVDPTPGGKNLGRMEWHVELLRGTKRRKGTRRFGGIAIWATQTRDTRYARVVFHIPMCCEGITTRRDRDDFTRFVWHIGFCSIHDETVLTAYPDNRHVALIVRAWSGISNELFFERSHDDQ